MAISKILNMKDCGGHFHGKHLKRALDYVMNPDKTQDGRLVGAINCQVDTAFEQMKETKRNFGKIDKRQGYHIILSFKGENVYIDTLTYEQFMMLGDAELNRRFSMQDEAEQKAKIDREQANELEYADESQKEEDSDNSGGEQPVRNPEREKPKWEDTITNRMMHWSYTAEQKEEVKKALAAGVPKATILTYFYPEVTVEKMSSYRKNQ